MEEHLKWHETNFHVVSLSVHSTHSIFNLFISIHLLFRISQNKMRYSLLSKGKLVKVLFIRHVLLDFYEEFTEQWLFHIFRNLSISIESLVRILCVYSLTVISPIPCEDFRFSWQWMLLTYPCMKINYCICRIWFLCFLKHLDLESNLHIPVLYLGKWKCKRSLSISLIVIVDSIKVQNYTEMIKCYVWDNHKAKTTKLTKPTFWRKKYKLQLKYKLPSSSP